MKAGERTDSLGFAVSSLPGHARALTTDASIHVAPCVIASGSRAATCDIRDSQSHRSAPISGAHAQRTPFHWTGDWDSKFFAGEARKCAFFGSKHMFSSVGTLQREAHTTLNTIEAVQADVSTTQDAEAETFRKRVEAGDTLVPVFRRIFADQLTPVMVYHRLMPNKDPSVPSFFLESVVNGDQQGRFSLLGSHPAIEIIAKEDQVEIVRHQQHHGEPRTNGTGSTSRSEKLEAPNPFKVIQDMSKSWKATRPTEIGLPDAFCGGWVGYTGYDTVRYGEQEKLPFKDAPTDDRNLPDIHLCLYKEVLVFDHVSKVLHAIHWVDMTEHDSVDAALSAGRARADALVLRAQNPIEDLPRGVVNIDPAGRRPGIMKSNMTKDDFFRGMETVAEHLRQGDSFQAVLSQRFERKTLASPFEIYRALRIVNPSPYMIYMHTRDAVLVASSPEILTRIHNRQIVNRPLAGTRPRGRTYEEDAALEQELLADEKDRAEHIMLVDLGRNDVGKVSKVGTVQVPKLMVIERYSHVMHISSTVTGTLKPELDAWDALQSELPAGTVSGAPKVRSMQIIDTLEPTRRGPYGGGIGVVGFDGNMDMALALRTMVIPLAKNSRQSSGRREWTVHIQAGAGLVADSVPESEYMETVNKAAALARAIDLAEDNFAS